MPAAEPVGPRAGVHAEASLSRTAAPQPVASRPWGWEAELLRAVTPFSYEESPSCAAVCLLAGRALVAKGPRVALVWGIS